MYCRRGWREWTRTKFALPCSPAKAEVPPRLLPSRESKHFCAREEKRESFYDGAPISIGDRLDNPSPHRTRPGCCSVRRPTRARPPTAPPATPAPTLVAVSSSPRMAPSAAARAGPTTAMSPGKPPGNVRANCGTLAFFWRARTPVGEAPFEIFRTASPSQARPNALRFCCPARRPPGFG